MRVRTDTAADPGEAVAVEETEPAENTTEAAPDRVDADDDVEEGAESASTSPDESSDTSESDEPAAARGKRKINWARVVAYGLLPALALLAAIAAGVLKWQDMSVRAVDAAAVESVAAAKESSAALLTYKPDTAEKDLGAAQDRLTGEFKNSYAKLTHDVVIPGAQQQHISAVANIAGAASVSAARNHAVALVFIDQTVVIGTSQPTDTASSVRVTLDKVDGRWLISAFDPI